VHAGAVWLVCAARCNIDKVRASEQSEARKSLLPNEMASEVDPASEQRYFVHYVILQ